MIFIDTNVLVYAFDLSEPAKSARAQALLTDAIETERGSLSTQVLGEFFTVVTRRIRNPMSPADARQVIDQVSILPVTEVDLSLVRRALDLLERYQLSYWDAQIVAAAERAGATQIASEDFGGSREYAGITVTNPFAGI